MNKFCFVLDTNILVSALLSPKGNPAKTYKLFLSGMSSLIYSSGIIEEYNDVLFRPHLKIPADDVKIVLSAILQFGQKIEPVGSTNIMIDEDEIPAPANEEVAEVKGVKKVKDVASDEEAPAKRKRIPTKKAPVKVPAKSPGKSPAKSSAKK